LAPFLVRGVITDCEVLAVNFLRFSKVRLSQSLLQELCDQFPGHIELAIEYADRVGLEKIRPPRRTRDLRPRFHCRVWYLRELCGRSGELNREELELGRTLLFEHSDELTNPSRWFYFLRYLRISVDSADDADRKSVAVNLRPMISDIPSDDSYVVKEMGNLLLLILPIAECWPLPGEFPFLAPVLLREITENDEFFMTEVPSLLIQIARHPTRYPKFQVLKLLETRLKTLFSDFFVAKEVMDLVGRNPSLIQTSDNLFPFLFDASLPIFPDSLKLIKFMVKVPTAPLQKYVTAIESLPSIGYSVPISASICSAFYNAMQAQSSNQNIPIKLEAQCRQVLYRLFIANPSIVNSRKLAKALIRATAKFDPLKLLLDELPKIESYFFAVYLVARKYYRAVRDEAKKRFCAALEATGAFSASKSRKLALLKMVANDDDQGFTLAMDDPDPPDQPPIIGALIRSKSAGQVSFQSKLND
jgi:hypothetical protein